MKDCRFCEESFKEIHYNQFYCSSECKTSGIRLVKKKYKKSEKGKISDQRWIRSDRRKTNETRYRQDPRVKHLLYLGVLRYQKNHPERAKEQQRVSYKKYSKTERGKQIILKVVQKYVRSDKGSISRRNAKARRRNALGRFTLEEWEQKLQQFGNRCANLFCRKLTKLTVDHIIPIILGGPNTIDNIQPLCKSCNSKKGVKVIRF